MTDTARPGWTFLTNHAQVLVCIARDPGIRLREIGERAGITERAAHRIVVELADTGYITRERNGRRNHYTINPRFPLPDPIAREQTSASSWRALPSAGDQPAGQSLRNERMIAGLLPAVGCALAGSLAVLLKQRGAAAPTVLARHPLRSAINLFCSKWWTVGWLVALGAWLLHVGALSLALLSTVQAVISGGLVLVAILAERFFGFQLGPGNGPGCWAPQSRWPCWG